MTTRRRKMKKSTKNILIVAVIIALFVAGYVAYRNIQLQSQLAGFQTTTKKATAYTFYVYDALNSSNDANMRDAVTINIYSKDVSSLTDSEIKDLVFSDFNLEKTIDSNISFTPDAKKDYIFKINGSDVVTKYYVTDYRLFNAKVPLVSLGNISVYCYNETEDVAMLAFDTETLSTTINQTDFREWEIQANCLDASEGSSAKETAAQGFESHFDPENNRNDWIVLKIEFNTTAQLSWVTYQSSDDYQMSASGNYIYIEVDRNIADSSNNFKFKFSSGLGSDFEAISAAIGYGSAASNTIWDTQN